MSMALARDYLRLADSASCTGRGGRAQRVALIARRAAKTSTRSVQWEELSSKPTLWLWRVVTDDSGTVVAAGLSDDPIETLERIADLMLPDL